MLILINGLNKDDYIYPGQKLMIPQDGLNIYVTKQGDTLESVARNFGVDFNVLGKENNRIFLVEDQLLTHKNN
jgi:LysM repeat protein